MITCPRIQHEWRRALIPKPLWTTAVKLAADCGISRTATALRLNYYDLKKHVESKAPSRREPSAFVELPSALSVPPECVIELENPAGSKMRIHLKALHTPDLVALSSGFWSMAR